MAGMTAQEAAEWGKTLSFETVWAALMETREKIDRGEERFDKIGERIDKMGERVDKTAEYIEKMAERVASVTANVGGLNLSMGDLIETLFAPNMGEKFDVYNYNFRRIFHRVPIYDDNSRQRSDIDILLSNTTVCMAVEVKRWLERTDQVDDNIKRMHLIRQYPPAEVKGKKLLGAIVGGVVTPEVREYAELSGFFVLELTGEDVRLLEPSKDFQPKEW
jgi:hypothetical protein